MLIMPKLSLVSFIKFYHFIRSEFVLAHTKIMYSKIVYFMLNTQTCYNDAIIRT